MLTSCNPGPHSLGSGFYLPLVSREWKNGSNSSYNCLLTKGKFKASGLLSLVTCRGAAFRAKVYIKRFTAQLDLNSRPYYRGLIIICTIFFGGGSLL